MKLQIDFDKKKIKLLEEVNLGKLVEILKGLFPDKWKEIKLESTVEYVNWYNPIVIREIQPWYQPWSTITCSDNTNGTITYDAGNSVSTSIMHNGVCNVDIQC